MPQTPGRPVGALDGLGLAAGVGAYTLWGILPLYFPLLSPATPVEIIAHRVVWSLIFCAILLFATRGWAGFWTALRTRRLLGLLSIAAVLLAINWVTYVFGVLTDRVVDASLGYFINPLVTVTLAVVVLRERLRLAQWVALGFGALAVVVLTLGYGQLPWIALVLACSFGLYGFIKNRVGPSVEALPGLAVETLVLGPFALGYLLWLQWAGDGTFAAQGVSHALIVAAAGIITSVPLLLFGSAARRLPLTMIGLLQYIAPTLQFVIGVAVLHEEMPPARWAGFALVWVAIVILTVDGLRNEPHQPDRTAGYRGRRVNVASTTITVTLSVPPAASAAATRPSAAS